MARSRGNAPETTDVVENTNTNTGGTKMSVVFQELDTDAVAALLAGSRQRGEYDRQIVNFVNSGLAAAEVNLTEGPFAGKKANSIKTGFESAIKRDGAPAEAKSVRVIVQADKVYLVKQES